MATTTNKSFYTNDAKKPMKLRLYQTYFKTMSYLRPKKTAKLLVKIFAKPRVNRASIVEKYENTAFLKNGIEGVVNFEDDEIFTYTEGNPEILLVSGWESSILRFETLMEKFRELNIGFLYFDLPGQGKSTGKMNNAVKTSRLIRKMIKENSTIHSIVGHSFGGASSYLALYLSQENEREIGNQIKNLVTVGSPSRYQSVVEPYYEFLALPNRIKKPFMDEIHRFVGIDFHRYDLLTSMNLDYDINLHMFHDEDDFIVPVEDAKRMKDLVIIHITKGLGHRRIMHTPEVIEEIVSIVVPQLQIAN